MKRGIKLEVIAQPGAAPDAVLARPNCVRDFHQAFATAKRLLGARGSYEAALSINWECVVIATPEFASWWTSRAGSPRNRFFLEVKAA